MYHKAFKRLSETWIQKLRQYVALFVTIAFDLFRSKMVVVDPSGNIFRLVTTGLSFGMIHVLSGPDHLSALVSLSVNGSCNSFCLGIQWGLGHSTGLILTALLFASGLIDLAQFATFGEPLVGIFMVSASCAQRRTNHF